VIEMEPLQLAIPMALALVVSLVCTPAVGRLAVAFGAVDRPSERGVNTRVGMPLWGGLAVAGAFLLGLGPALWLTGAVPPEGRLGGLLIGGTIVLITGLYDDRYGMKAGPKLLLQLVAAAVAILHGFKIDRFTEPISLITMDIPDWIGWIATTLWIVGVTNALNLLDGLDGLAAGVGAIIGATLTVIAWQAGSPFGMCLGVALVGALLGFLRHNFSPARIFLGDTGSLFIGYTLALLALEGYRRVSLLTFVVPLLALAVPILDTSLSILRRLRLGAPIFAADRLHMHHRLLAVEGSPRAAVLQFYFLTAAFCLIAVSFTKLQGYAAAIFLAAVAGLTVRLLWNLGVLSIEADGSKGDVPTGAEEKKS
jgi:UDP-GlcNAc:undecaprenyl-phosphate GlcNAc-1-phosphate transferase